jgi:citrate lyase subunit beta/citryl-CoA lyase
VTAAVRPRRSALYLPASNARALAKARTLACDVVILDLEDAVAPEQKAAARDAAVAAVRAHRDGTAGFGGRELVVRINALTSEWGEADCRALGEAAPDAVLVPKVNAAADVAAVAVRVPDVPIWAMVETARSVLRLDSIAAAPGLAALVMGTNDLAKELGAAPGADRLPFLGLFTQAVAAARAYRLAVLDGVHNAIDDTAGLAAECAQAVRFGFDGKTLIHPAQIDACNAAFSPSAEAIAWAETVEHAFAVPEAAGKGAIRVEGQMVERLHLDQARRILALVRAARTA